MRRETDDGFLCGVCLERVFRGACACEPPIDQEMLFCQHTGEKKINLSTAMLECAECEEPIFDLNPQLSPVLRVVRA